MTSFEAFKKLISKIEYSEVKTSEGITIGWNAYIYDSNNIVKAGGTATTKDVAMRIAYAELIERSTFQQISKDEMLKSKFRISEFPTTCGFAAGFSKEDTRTRAICEAVERWCFSEWIDKRKYIDNYIPTEVSSLTRGFLEKFDSVQFFIKKINIQELTEITVDDLYFCACLGYKGDGVFLGSRVSNNFVDLLQHSVIEAYRAYIIYQNLTTSSRKNNFYTDRINYWGKNKAQLPDFKNFSKTDFAKPKLAVLEEYSESSEYFIFRALCGSFNPWHVGDEKRFVY